MEEDVTFPARGTRGASLGRTMPDGHRLLWARYYDRLAAGPAPQPDAAPKKARPFRAGLRDSS
jgi:hypothetical protein